MDKAKAVAFVKKRLAWMDKEIIDEQMSAVKKGYDFQILPSELKYSKEEAEDLLDHLQNKNQRLFVYTGLVFTWAETRKELDDQVLQIVSTGRRNSIEIGTLDYRQRQGMNSVLPLGHNHVEVSRMMTTAQVAIQMPFATQELAQEGGGYYGQNKQSSNLVLCNRKHLASPMGFVAGKPGSGKSFSVKREIENTILAYPEDEIIIRDPAGEYSPVVTGNGGESIRFAPDSGTHLNPFDLSDVAHQSTAAQMAFKIDAFLALSSATMAEGSQGLPEADKSIISRCVELAYARCADEGRLPLLGDFYSILREQPEPEARDIALRYERYVRGALSFFNHESNVTFDKRITNIDFKDLSYATACTTTSREASRPGSTSTRCRACSGTPPSSATSRSSGPKGASSTSSARASRRTASICSTTRKPATWCSIRTSSCCTSSRPSTARRGSTSWTSQRRRRATSTSP